MISPNPKSESRNPKQIRMPNRKNRIGMPKVAALDFGFVSDFEIRISDFYPFAGSAVSPAFLRLSQLYFFWNFSTRPVVSRNFILPVKKGWQAEQISTVMFFLVLRVLNLLPQPQTTVASSYLG